MGRRRFCAMNAKENALRIIHFDHPERVVNWLPIHYVCYHGCNHRGFDGGEAHDGPVGSKWFDIWGTRWHKIHGGVMGLPKGYPLAHVNSLKSYEWPNPDDERICGKIYRMAESFAHDTKFLTGHHRDTLWEKSYMLVGMENIMIYLLTEPGFAKEVFHRIMDFQLGIAQHYVNVGVEHVLLGDDLGTQRGPLVGPRIVAEFLVPEYERLFRFYKERDVLITFHSCGKIEAFLDIFIKLGVDVLNPLQVTANDLDEVRARTKGRMALQGGVSSATVMDGPVDRIAAEVRERIWQLGQDGGYFCDPDQDLPFPKRHTEAFRRAVEEYGCYPLQPPSSLAY
jgi:uroporphyrinogen decarboxylase